MALWALAIGAFGIGMTEFLIAGILGQVSYTFETTIPQAGYMVTSYALGVFVAAPIAAIIGPRWPRKQVLIGTMEFLMVAFGLATVSSIQK